MTNPSWDEISDYWKYLDAVLGELDIDGNQAANVAVVIFEELGRHHGVLARVFAENGPHLTSIGALRRQRRMGGAVII